MFCSHHFHLQATGKDVCPHSETNLEGNGQVMAIRQKGKTRKTFVIFFLRAAPPSNTQELQD